MADRAAHRAGEAVRRHVGLDGRYKTDRWCAGDLSEVALGKGAPVKARRGGLEPVARSSVVDAVVERLREEVLSGRIGAGERLPPERELAVSLGVNRLTLRAALARLEALGLVATRHGAGTVATAWQERAGLEALAGMIALLRPSDPAWGALVRSLFEVRRVLVAEVIALAAERRDESDLEDLAVLAENQRELLDDPLAFAAGDVAFLRRLVRAARSVAFELVLNSFARFTEEEPELVVALYGAPAQAAEFYPVVLALLEAGNGDGARLAVREALEEVDDRKLSALTGGRGGPSSPARRRGASRSSGGDR